MSWAEIFFGFQGRINRRTFWAGWISMGIAGVLFTALLAGLATGDPASPDIWRTPAGKEDVWVPVWLAWLAAVAWPLSALAIKRLHDRDRPAWLWYAYYCMTIVFSMPPLKNATPAELGPAASAAMIVPLIFGIYVFVELSLLRGTRGPNSYGGDTLPADYFGGDYNFLSLMLALEGRISRAKWWFGMLITVGVVIAALMAMGVVVEAFSAKYPGFQENMSNPAWLASPEAVPVLMDFELWAIVPIGALVLAAWSLMALGVKRLHDRGLSSWLILVVVLPFLGAIVLPSSVIGESAVRLLLVLLMASAIWSVLQFGIFKGETGPNQYGPDPLAGRD